MSTTRRDAAKSTIIAADPAATAEQQAVVGPRNSQPVHYGSTMTALYFRLIGDLLWDYAMCLRRHIPAKETRVKELLALAEKRRNERRALNPGLEEVVWFQIDDATDDGVDRTCRLSSTLLETTRAEIASVASSFQNFSSVSAAAASSALGSGIPAEVLNLFGKAFDHQYCTGTTGFSASLSLSPHLGIGQRPPKIIFDARRRLDQIVQTGPTLWHQYALSRLLNNDVVPHIGSFFAAQSESVSLYASRGHLAKEVFESFRLGPGDCCLRIEVTPFAVFVGGLGQPSLPPGAVGAPSSSALWQSLSSVAKAKGAATATLVTSGVAAREAGGSSAALAAQKHDEELEDALKSVFETTRGRVFVLVDQVNSCGTEISPRLLTHLCDVADQELTTKLFGRGSSSSASAAATAASSGETNQDRFFSRVVPLVDGSYAASNLFAGGCPFSTPRIMRRLIYITSLDALCWAPRGVHACMIGAEICGIRRRPTVVEDSGVAFLVARMALAAVTCISPAMQLYCHQIAREAHFLLAQAVTGCSASAYRAVSFGSPKRKSTALSESSATMAAELSLTAIASPAPTNAIFTVALPEGLSRRQLEVMVPQLQRSCNSLVAFGSVIPNAAALSGAAAKTGRPWCLLLSVAPHHELNDFKQLAVGLTKLVTAVTGKDPTARRGEQKSNEDDEKSVGARKRGSTFARDMNIPEADRLNQVVQPARKIRQWTTMPRSLQNRLVTLLARYDPDEIKHVRLTLAATGKDPVAAETLLDRMIIRYGPEPQFHEFATKLEAFFLRHATAQISKVPLLVEEYSGREEELFAKLEERFAVTINANGDKRLAEFPPLIAPLSEDERVAREAAVMRLTSSPAAIQQLLQSTVPSRSTETGLAEMKLREAVERELLDGNASPQRPQRQILRLTVERLMRHYRPHRLKELPLLMYLFKGRLGHLEKLMREEFGELPAMPEATRANNVRVAFCSASAALMVRFGLVDRPNFLEWLDAKAIAAEASSRQHQEAVPRRARLLQKGESLFPSFNVDSKSTPSFSFLASDFASAATPARHQTTSHSSTTMPPKPQSVHTMAATQRYGDGGKFTELTDLERRIYRMYEQYNPSMVPHHVDELLSSSQWKDRKDLLLSALIAKYGPEPPQDKALTTPLDHVSPVGVHSTTRVDQSREDVLLFGTLPPETYSNNKNNREELESILRHHHVGMMNEHDMRSQQQQNNNNNPHEGDISVFTKPLKDAPMSAANTIRSFYATRRTAQEFPRHSIDVESVLEELYFPPEVVLANALYRASSTRGVAPSTTATQ